jgi:hypothetical protein
MEQKKLKQKIASQNSDLDWSEINLEYLKGQVNEHFKRMQELYLEKLDVLCVNKKLSRENKDKDEQLKKFGEGVDMETLKPEGRNEILKNLASSVRSIILDNIQKEVENQMEEKGVKCPISGNAFISPVVSSKGQTYEQNDITTWLNRKNTCPLTSQSMSASELHPNYALITALEFLRKELHEKIKKEE